ncbi:Protein of uncharacterised function (DUF2580) [Mycobacteroides abscessus subsp. abscessus]|uniref:type VII secretion target n=1 Tax=Mycobacteroides abscessus TaxID=36809 RepID=UPI0009277489|nr:type VII secretion target [Mycobacteroides abscessus]SHU71309.1 Protein of uncharacterised function (DUF2580) [Mycobacteroides abscessus subsp. abscessus]
MTNPPQGPYALDYAQIEEFAAQHDQNAEQIMQWAIANPDFPQQYLDTHGKVNYATFLKIVEYYESKVQAGTAFSDRQAHTANGLRTSLQRTIDKDRENAGKFPTDRVDDPNATGPTQPRMSDFGGGVNRAPDPNAPVIKSAPTYPMNGPSQPTPTPTPAPPPLTGVTGPGALPDPSDREPARTYPMNSEG